MTVRSTLAPNGKPLHLPALDGLRGVAILLVLYLHLMPGIPDSGRILGAMRAAGPIGQVGVDLFFVLSGFLITRLLLYSRGSPSYYSSFYGRRAVRIFPLYFGALFVYFFLSPWLTSQPVAPLSVQAWYWLYANNIAYTFNVPLPGPNHFWSLAVEEHFYLVWPTVVAAIAPERLRWASLGIIALAVVTRAALLSAGLGVFYFTLSRVDALAAGALLAVWERDGRLLQMRRAFLLGGGAVVLALAGTFGWLTGRGLDVVQLTKFTFVALAFLSFIGYVLTADDRTWLVRVLSHRALRFVGTISYGLYVIHPFVFAHVFDAAVPGGTAGTVAVALGATFALSVLVYRFYELPFLTLKRRFAYRTAAAPDATPRPVA